MKNYLFLCIPVMLFLGCDKDDEIAEVLEEDSALQEEHCSVCVELSTMVYDEVDETVCDNLLAIDAYVENWESQDEKYCAECLEVNSGLVVTACEDDSLTMALYVEGMETFDSESPDQDFECDVMYLQDFYCETYLNN